MSHQKQNETDTLRQELEEDWVAYVTHLKNVDTPSSNSSYLSAKPGTSSKTEVKSSSCTVDGSCCKSKPEMSLSADSPPPDNAKLSEINISSGTLAVHKSDVNAFSCDDKFSERTADDARCSSLSKAEDSRASTATAAASTLIEYKVPQTTSTESGASVAAGMLNEGNQDPCDIMSVLTCDLRLHVDELDAVGKSLFEKYLPKLETLLTIWKTE